MLSYSIIFTQDSWEQYKPIYTEDTEGANNITSFKLYVQ